MLAWSCILAALCSMVANCLKIAFYVNLFKNGRNKWNWTNYLEFQPDYLEEAWNRRISNENLYVASGIFNSIAWIILVFPICHMAWILSKKGTKSIGLNVGIGLVVLIGGMFELLSNLFIIGMNVVMIKLVKMFEEDENTATWIDRPDLIQNGDDEEEGLGWQVLELNHVVGQGFLTYTDSFEWICLTCMFILIFISVRQWLSEGETSFGGRWNCLGLFIGLVCLLEFGWDVVKFQFRYLRINYKIFGYASIVIAIFNRLILIPSWIIALGVMIPRAERKITGSSSDIQNELALTEMKSNESTQRNQDESPNFTIEDTEET